MYELEYKPERLDWNVYFIRFKETGDIRFFREFLHFYEPVLDRKIGRFIEHYELEDYRAEDFKQIFSFLLWEELQSYDSEIPLLQLIKYKVQTAWHEYVRVNCGNFQVDNRHQYLLLKKIAYLYYQKKDNNSLSEIIPEIAAELEITEENVEEYIIAVSTFKPKYNADYYANDDEDVLYSSAMDSVANDLDTEALYFKLLRQEKLNSALADLRKPDRLLIEYVYGICPKCLKNGKMKAAGIVPMQPFSCPQTATNRLCRLCWARSGCYPNFYFARHGAKQGASCEMSYCFIKYVLQFAILCCTIFLKGG